MRAAPPQITDLAGTNWRVVLVNDRSTPATGDYSVRFDSAGEASIRFGCNSLGGRYQLRVDVLTVSDLATTLMGCPEPSATFEREGSAILGRPMRIAFTSNDRMYLSNDAGSIAVDPVR